MVPSRLETLALLWMASVRLELRKQMFKTLFPKVLPNPQKLVEVDYYYLKRMRDSLFLYLGRNLKGSSALWFGPHLGGCQKCRVPGPTSLYQTPGNWEHSVGEGRHLRILDLQSSPFCSPSPICSLSIPRGTGPPLGHVGLSLWEAHQVI